MLYVQNEELIPNIGATSVALTWFQYEKSDMDRKYLFIEFIENVLHYLDIYAYLDIK